MPSFKEIYVKGYMWKNEYIYRDKSLVESTIMLERCAWRKVVKYCLCMQTVTCSASGFVDEPGIVVSKEAET